MNFQIADDSHHDAFNQFVSDFSTGDLLQSYEWAQLKGRGGWGSVKAIAETDGRIVAAASILTRRIPRTNRCLMYCPRGPVLDTADADVVQEFVAFLKKIALQRRAIMLKIDPPVPIDDKVSEANLRSAGFVTVVSAGFGGVQPKAVMQLDLDKSEDDLLASFKPKWRYNIRLAERKGVEVDLDCSKDQLPAFYKLLQETCKRDGFLVRSYSYFEDMYDILGRAGFIRLVLTRYEGEPVAGALMYIFGDKAMYTYGASSNQHRNVMPNHLMQWEMIKLAMSRGCKWYDFRGVSPKKESDPEDHLQGLNRFKEGFSPRFVEYVGEYDLVLSPVFYWLWNVAVPRVRHIMKARSRSAGSAQAEE